MLYPITYAPNENRREIAPHTFKSISRVMGTSVSTITPEMLALANETAREFFGEVIPTAICTAQCLQNWMTIREVNVQYAIESRERQLASCVSAETIALAAGSDDEDSDDEDDEWVADGE